MFSILAPNVNLALPIGMKFLMENGKIEETRNGPAYVVGGPVTTLYTEPRQRVLFSPARDANPFFHFMEGLWMLNGNNDVAWISQFSKNIEQFSDNGKSFHGAYGFRWRSYFGFDQLERAINILKANPNDRRCVIQMWDAEGDLGKTGKDFPCNTQIMFRVSDGHLDMTVINRSNDIIWGAYGANVVHMSMLQEFMADAIGLPVGGYWQISNNFHGYAETMTKHEGILHEPSYDYYDPLEHDEKGVTPFPKMIFTDVRTWQEDLSVFIENGPVVGFRDKFFRHVAVPIYVTWKAIKAKQWEQALQNIDNCRAMDWHMACKEWIQRRMPL